MTTLNLNMKHIENHNSSTFTRTTIRRGIAVVNVETSAIGVVSRVMDNCVTVAAHCNVKGELCTDEIVMHLQDCRPAAQEEKQKLQRLLNRVCMLWDMRRCQLKRNDYVPQNGARVQLSTLGSDAIIGVFKEIDAQGRVIMYCLLRPGEQPAYSMHEIACAAADCQIQPIGSTARKKFGRALAAEGVVWNGHLKCMEMAGTRLLREHVYYYLDDLFEICEVRDTYKPRDRKRLAAGNYFATREAAESMRECLASILRMRHSAEAEGRRTAKKTTSK